MLCLFVSMFMWLYKMHAYACPLQEYHVKEVHSYVLGWSCCLEHSVWHLRFTIIIVHRRLCLISWTDLLTTLIWCPKLLDVRFKHFFYAFINDVIWVCFVWIIGQRVNNSWLVVSRSRSGIFEFVACNKEVEFLAPNWGDFSRHTSSTNLQRMPQQQTREECQGRLDWWKSTNYTMTRTAKLEVKKANGCMPLCSKPHESEAVEPLQGQLHIRHQAAQHHHQHCSTCAHHLPYAWILIDCTKPALSYTSHTG